MNFKENLLIGVAVVAVIGLAYWYQRPNAQELSSETASVPAVASTPWANPFAKSTGDASKQTAVAQPLPAGDLSYNTASFKGAPLPERLAAMSARRNGRAFNPQEVADALKSDVAWESDPGIANQLALSDAERKDGREFVRVNPMKIEALMKGDEMSLPINQMKKDGPVRMVIDEVEQGAGDNITWHGHLKDFDTENQVSFTRGESLIVGGVSKPDKNYVVQINGDVGWIVDGFAIFKGKHDAIVPPGKEGGASTDDGHSHSHSH